MYYVNKIIGWALSPLGFLFLGCLGGAVLRVLGGRLGKRSLRRLGSALILLAFALLWIFSCNITTRFIGVPLEGEEVPLADTLELGGCDAVVLLGGGMGLHERCGRAEMFTSADRVWEAARQWKAHQDGNVKLAMSGGGVEWSTAPLLKDLGVDEKALVFFPAARNTEEEARMIAAAGFKRIRLVTSAWHMPRAKTLFERAGLEVIPAPTDYEMHCFAELSPRPRDFVPSSDALNRNSFAVKEWVARFCYWLKGTVGGKTENKTGAL